MCATIHACQCLNAVSKETHSGSAPALDSVSFERRLRKQRAWEEYTHTRRYSEAEGGKSTYADIAWCERRLTAFSKSKRSSTQRYITEREGRVYTHARRYSIEREGRVYTHTRGVILKHREGGNIIGHSPSERQRVLSAESSSVECTWSVERVNRSDLDAMNMT